MWAEAERPCPVSILPAADRIGPCTRMGRASCGDNSSITGRISAVESADAVKAEAVGTVIGAVEDGRRRIASHWLACPLEPAAILGALALKSTPFGFVGNVVAGLALVLAERANF